MPAIDESGASGGQVLMRVNRRGVTTYMTVLGGTTALTGLYLFWHFTGGFDPAVSVSHAGVAFGTGGVAGILAGIIGGGVVGRSAKAVANIMSRAVNMPDGPAMGALIEQTVGLRRRIKAGSSVVIVLQTIALVVMAVGHYI
jgi:hypothetical protein